ncbi:MAG: hypothetical protein WC529_08415 [Candidatus Margulisiibacteriota bacterium]
MVVRTTPKVNTGRLVLASIHANTRCRPPEQERIAQIRDSQLPVSTWWSFLHTADMQRPEPYAPDKIQRHVYDPEHQVDFQATPLGNRFILVGGSINNQLPNLFAQICRFNTRRFVDLEFHLPLDAIGISGFDLDKYQYAINPYNRFCDALRQMAVERQYNSALYFDGEPLGKFNGRSKLNVFLQWHMSVDSLIASLLPGNTVH